MAATLAERAQSRLEFDATLRKNWEPPELGRPVLAIERVPGPFVSWAPRAELQRWECVSMS